MKDSHLLSLEINISMLKFLMIIQISSIDKEMITVIKKNLIQIDLIKILHFSKSLKNLEASDLPAAGSIMTAQMSFISQDLMELLVID